MSWITTFVIYRVEVSGTTEVFQSSDLKKAKYWLTYIAQVGDVMCKTPIHPKHTAQSKFPEYWSHKEQSGKAVTSEATWKNWLSEKALSPDFPESQTENKTATLEA